MLPAKEVAWRSVADTIECLFAAYGLRLQAVGWFISSPGKVEQNIEKGEPGEDDMPQSLTYPGVYIEEVPSGVRPITGVQTAVTAFVGRAKSGPVNMATPVTSFAEFDRKFGGLWYDGTMTYAVRDFFVNQGSQAVIVRAFRKLKQLTLDLDGSAEKLIVRARNTPSGKDELRVRIEHGSNAEPHQFDLHVALVRGATAETAGDVLQEEEFRNLSMRKSDPRRVDTVLNASRLLTALEPDIADSENARPMAHEQVSAEKPLWAINGTNSALAEEADPDARVTLDLDGSTEKWVVRAANAGPWGNELRVRIDHDKNAAHQFDLRVALVRGATDTKAGEVLDEEAFSKLSLRENDPRRVDRVLQASRLLRADNPGVMQNPDARPKEHAQVSGKKPLWADNDTSSALADGNDGDVLDGSVVTAPQLEAGKCGIYALLDSDIFNLLCIPPFERGASNPSTSIDEAVAFCFKQRAMLIIDPPSEWTSADQASSNIAKAGTASPNAAVFFPNLHQPDPENSNQMDAFAPCGAIAGVMARTDAERGVWKAPAGLAATLAGVPALSIALTNPDIGKLNPKGVNCLRPVPDLGRVVWGARTRQGSDALGSEWKYIPVRRLTLFIEESLYRGTQWVVFEPNDEPLWSSIRLNVGAFMHSLYRQGAFQGRSPREAYVVRCDDDTTTQDDINRGIVNILVGFAPLKPAEFVVIKIQQLAGQVQA